MVARHRFTQHAQPEGVHRENAETSSAFSEQLAEEIRQVFQQREVCVVPLILTTAGVVPRSLTKSLTKLYLPATLGHKIKKAVNNKQTDFYRPPPP